MCGIGAVYNPKQNLVRELYSMGVWLQHRGFESAGMAASVDSDLIVYARPGHVGDVFHELAKVQFNSRAGIFHTRYSTTGVSGAKNAQPIKVGKVAIGHNGNLVNTDELRQRFEGRYELSTTTDSELIGCIFDEAGNYFEGVDMCRDLCSGSYNLVLLNKSGELGVFRDPSGNHPLFAGYSGNSFYAASEDCALRALSPEKIEEVKPGELIVVSEKGIERKILPARERKICSFEPMYFENFGSTFKGRTIGSLRKAVGARLAELYPVDADFVIPVLESGLSYAFGYSNRSGLPLEEGIPKNNFLGRTYMLPEGKDMETPEVLRLSRGELVRLKHIPIPEIVAGKRVVLIDDSIVRKNVSMGITKALRDARAKEVHLRIGYPPVTHPCFYGLDHAERRKLAAARFSDPIEAGNHIAEQIGADSVRYIPENELRGVLGNGDLCFSCVNGEYWTDIPNTPHFIEALKL